MRNPLDLRRGLPIVLGAGVTIACSGLLDVESPVRVPASRLNDPALAPVLVQGAIADFECAFGAYAGLTGMVTDELSTSAAGAIFPVGWDRRIPATGDNLACPRARTQQNGDFGLWRPLSTARFQADNAYSRIQAFPDAAVPTKARLLATLAAYGGYAYALIGEGFCRAAFDGGPALSPSQVLALAEQRFDTALALATRAGDTDILNLARVGRARVRLDRGKTTEAASDAAQVTSGYIRYATFSSDSPRRLNEVVWLNSINQLMTVDPRFRNLTVGGVPDPRVPVVDAGRRGQDGIVPLWLQMKYPTESSPIPIASWNEAQLIIAEVEGGQSAVSRINALRAKASLPAFSSADSATIAQQVREERRRELFLDGHRLNDMLRFSLPFDSGRNLKGQTYGTMTCVPLPTSETDNNPNLGQ